MLGAGVYAQSGALDTSKVMVNKDPRLDILAKLEAEFNGVSARYGKGYRLLILKSNNRDYTLKVRASLLQAFPEQKVIMTYQAPFIKLKFGDFTDKAEAERYRDMILGNRMVSGNIYIIAETVELKPDKKEEEL